MDTHKGTPLAAPIWSLGWQHVAVIGCLLSDKTSASYAKLESDLAGKSTDWIGSAFAGREPIGFLELLRGNKVEWNELTWDWSQFNSNTISIQVVDGIGSTIQDIAMTLDTLYLPASLFPTATQTNARTITRPSGSIRIYTIFDAADALIECDDYTAPAGQSAGYDSTLNTKANTSQFGNITDLGTFQLWAEGSWMGTSRVEKYVNAMSPQPTASLRVVVGQNKVKLAPDGMPLESNLMPAWPCGALAGAARPSTTNGCP